MRKFFCAMFTALALLPSAASQAQIANDHTVLSTPWNAYWIAPANDPGREYGVYYFRKTLDLAVKPPTFIIKVSADNRYKLYVNGKLISVGPARGDSYYWNYETVDLAPYLTAGKNSIAAIVWNEAESRPEAQISLRTAFILQGSTANEEVLNTGRSWKCFQNKGYAAITGVGYPTYYVAGPGELVDMNKAVKNWMTADFDDHNWPDAAQLEHGKPKGMSDAFGWMLVPSVIPQMERTLQRIPVLRKAEGVTPPAGFPATQTVVTIPANTTATLLLDQTYLTSAYVTLNFSGGKGAAMSLMYNEALFDNLKKFGSRKGNRNDVEGKDFAGRRDSIISDGTAGQSFNTLYWRTYRYIRLRVQTQDDPLTIDDLCGTFTGYPFQRNASMKTDNPEIQQILDIGWRTARLDAMETYMDCPFYEQLQYIGDTRIQAMVSYYDSGDDRLARNAISLMDHSRIAEGLTLSRHPSYSPQIIPTFSLWYVGVLHDYWMYRPDSNFVKDKLPGVRDVLNFFSRYQQADGSVKNVPYWNFIDWAGNGAYDYSHPPTGKNGGSSIMDMQLMMAYSMAAEMEKRMGMPTMAILYKEKAAQLEKTIRSKYWDAPKGLYADNEDKDLFSQHANSLAILTGLIKGPEAAAVAKKMLADSTLTQCTIYFKYYLHQALVKAGLGNGYLDWLGIWRQNIAMGLTTWAEISDLPHARSDCHAWGASPNIEFFRTVLGIDSYAPGFSKVKIEPHLGMLTDVSGEMPHPNGKIAVVYKKNGSAWKISITLPYKTTGMLIWKGKTYALKPGLNSF